MVSPNLNEFWWTRGGLLCKIIAGNDPKNIYVAFSATIIWIKSPEKLLPNIYTFYIDKNGKAAFHYFDLIQKESNRDVILKAILGLDISEYIPENLRTEDERS